MYFNAETRIALTGLAEGLLPLQQWVMNPMHTYQPPDAAALPWRSGLTLTHERLQTIEYVEWLIAASDADDLLLARWDRIGQDPLLHCPIPAARAFREGRGLSLSPRFATVEAGNALADAGGRQMSRRHLYQQCTPILVRAVAAARKRDGMPTDSSFWTMLAEELHRGNCPEWRAVAGAPQSTLLTEQLLRDVITALLNGWLDVPAPWRYAVLIELGEFRRPGNAFQRADVDKATAALKKALKGKAATASVSSEAAKTEPDVTADAVRHATQWKSVP
jgi:hypothetical protein